jgi:hypothetical protein
MPFFANNNNHTPSIQGSSIYDILLHTFFIVLPPLENLIYAMIHPGPSITKT